MKCHGELVHDLTRLAAYSVTHPGWRRLRIAVSPAEFQELREHMLHDTRRFFARVMDIPVVVEEHPLAPDLEVELADDRKT